jgi:YebC/PmpR family DNA-binding regulatory protein
MATKTANNAKKGKIYSKYGRLITIAVKEGGGSGDPAKNTKLRTAIEQAKQMDMPKENIERAISKATMGDAENYEEIRYEGYGPGGVSLIIEALTDNRNRTATNVRTAVGKNGGNLGVPGAVSHGFDRLGLITYPAKAGDADKVFEAALEAGAEDVQSSEDGHEIWTAMEALHEVSKALEPVLGAPEGAKLAWKPQTMVAVDEANATTLLKLLDALEEDDDVQTVWGNYEIPDEVMEKLG